MISANNWVPDGTADQGPSNPEWSDFREALEDRYISPASIADAHDSPTPGDCVVSFRSFGDAYRFVQWLQRRGGLRREVMGPTGLAALWLWLRGQESGVYAVRVNRLEMPQIARLLDEGWDMLPGRPSVAWARWSR
jgi:hypothetical protein